MEYTGNVVMYPNGYKIGKKVYTETVYKCPECDFANVERRLVEEHHTLSHVPAGFTSNIVHNRHPVLICDSCGYISHSCDGARLHWSKHKRYCFQCDKLDDTLMMTQRVIISCLRCGSNIPDTHDIFITGTDVHDLQSCITTTKTIIRRDNKTHI